MLGEGVGRLVGRLRASADFAGFRGIPMDVAVLLVLFRLGYDVLMSLGLLEKPAPPSAVSVLFLAVMYRH